VSGGALRAQFFTFGGALRAQFVKLGGALRAQFVNLAARYTPTCAHCDEGATVLLNDGHAKAGQRSVDSPTAERHMGHIDTSAAQTAHILRWRHGSSTTVLGCSRHTTHDEPPSSTSGGGDAAAGGGTAGSLWAGPALLLPRVPRRAAQETAKNNTCRTDARTRQRSHPK
jgi:hypothetical protein